MSRAAFDLETLPFPVAYPLSYARDEVLGVSDRVDNVFFAGYQAVRTTALLLLADYLESSETCPRVSEAIRGLRLPHWKEWVELATTLAKFWKGHYDQRPERQTRFPSLVMVWLETAAPGRSRTDGDWPTLLKGSAGGHGPAKGPVDALWYARNSRTHGTGTRTGDPARDAALLARLLPLLEALTAALFPPGAFTLLRRVSESEEEGLRVIRLHGPHRDRCFEAEALGEEWASAFETTGVAALADGEAVVIHPLFLPPGPDLAGGPVEGGGLLEDLYLVDRVSERKVVALGVLDERRLPERLIADVTAALRRKQVELGLDREATRRWNLVDWSASTARRLLGDLANRKYFPDFYYERPDVDATLRRTMELERPRETLPRSASVPTPARGRALLLLGEAGSGKSSLLCRLVDGLLREQAEDDEKPEEKKKGSRGKRKAKAGGSADLSRYLEGRGGGDVVLYLSGAAAYGGDVGKEADALLCDAVVRQGGVLTGAFPTLEHFVTKLDESAVKNGRDADRNPDRKVWIVLDGINEADRFKDLVGALDRFLPHVAQRPWLRLVVSIRSGAYHELERKDRDAMVHEGAVFRNASCWASFPGDRPDAFGRKQDVPYLEVRPFAAGREGAEAYRLRQAWKGGKSSEIRYEDLPPGVKTLLLSPLHLHLFHETWAGQARVPVDLDEMGLFEAFLTRLTNEHPGLEERLQLLAEVMLETRQALLPIEVAERWEEEAGGQAATMAKRHAKLTPVEELVAASILMRPVEEGQGSQRRLIGYRFSHQSLTSAVLARHLRARLKGREVPPAEELLDWAREASGEGPGGHGPFPELVDAVATYVVACTKAGDGEAVATMLDLENEDVRNDLTRKGLVAYGPLRGSEERPGPVAEQFWRGFTKAAATSRRGVRFDRAAWKAQRSSERNGFSRAAADIGVFRTASLREAVAADPGRLGLKRDLAVSLNGLSDLRVAAGRGEEAVKLLEESLAAMRELVAAQPERLDWKRDLTVSLNRLSDLRASAGRGPEARRLSEESVALMRELVAAEPGRLNWKRGLTVGLNQLSNLREAEGRVAEAEELAEEDLTVSRQLVAADPQRLDLKANLAGALNRLSELQDQAGRTLEAQDLAEEDVLLARELVAAGVERLDWKRELSASLLWLSRLRERAGRLTEAEALAEEDIALSRELIAADPARLDWQEDLAVSLKRLSSFRERAGRREAAESLTDEFVALTRGLVDADPGRLDWKRDLAVSLRRLSDLRAGAGRAPEAERLSEESLALMRELVAKEPGRLAWKRDLTMSLSHLSDLRASLGRGEDAEALSEQTIALSRQLVAADPERRKWKRDLAAYLNRLSDLQLYSGRHVVPSPTAEESLALRRNLWEENPDEPAAIYSLVVGLDTLARVRIEDGEMSLAQECFQHAESLWLRLPESDREAPHNQLEWARMLAIRARLEPRNPDAYGRLKEAQRIVVAQGDRGNVAFKLLCVERDIRDAEEAVKAVTAGDPPMRPEEKR